MPCLSGFAHVAGCSQVVLNRTTWFHSPVSPAYPSALAGAPRRVWSPSKCRAAGELCKSLKTSAQNYHAVISAESFWLKQVTKLAQKNTEPGDKG